ncbi:hypothetical protein [Streptomyces sp. NPDC058092]|uniref:hypothetical protein n=1 Tax=Streptomyces sp. NPDC058092 TaxID=3346336 RepID=UPI0036E77072
MAGVISDPLELVGALAAELAKAPLVRHRWGPQIPSLLGSPGAGVSVDQWPDALRQLFEKYGAEVRAEYGVCTVDPTPTSLQSLAVPTGWPPGTSPATVRAPCPSGCAGRRAAPIPGPAGGSRRRLDA